MSDFSDLEKFRQLYIDLCDVEKGFPDVEKVHLLWTELRKLQEQNYDLKQENSVLRFKLRENTTDERILNQLLTEMGPDELLAFLGRIQKADGKRDDK